MVKVLDSTPHPSVCRTCVCSHCGATLTYTPEDVKREGSDDSYTFFGIICSKCNKLFAVKPTPVSGEVEGSPFPATVRVLMLPAALTSVLILLETFHVPGAERTNSIADLRAQFESFAQPGPFASPEVRCGWTVTRWTTRRGPHLELVLTRERTLLHWSKPNGDLDELHELLPLLHALDALATACRAHLSAV